LAAQQAFSGIIVVGHIGKLIKLAGGIMNTHSRVADGRLDILALHAGLAGGDAGLMRSLLDAPTVDAGLDLLAAQNLTVPVLRSILGRIDLHLRVRLAGTVPAGAIIFSNRSGHVCISDAADSLLRQWNIE
jgi:cobalt-precorrin-5B (C1)-methyltransferase